MTDECVADDDDDDGCVGCVDTRGYEAPAAAEEGMGGQSTKLLKEVAQDSKYVGMGGMR